MHGVVRRRWRPGGWGDFDLSLPLLTEQKKGMRPSGSKSAQYSLPFGVVLLVQLVADKRGRTKQVRRRVLNQGFASSL